MCALADGRSVESTMGFTALDGSADGHAAGPDRSRCRALPHATEGDEPAAVEGPSLSRMRPEGAVRHQQRHARARSERGPARGSRIDYFVYRIGLHAGMLAAALGGLDAFVFTAGIGENSAAIRARIAEKLAWLGAELDPAANAAAQLDLDAEKPGRALRGADRRGTDDRTPHARRRRRLSAVCCPVKRIKRPSSESSRTTN